MCERSPGAMLSSQDKGLCDGKCWTFGDKQGEVEVTLLISFMWLGGASVAYSVKRQRGHGRLGAAFEAAAWPLDLACKLAEWTYEK
jgi:hypothetical protein